MGSFWEGRSRPYDYLSGSIAAPGADRVRGGRQYGRLAVDLERKMLVVAARLLAKEHEAGPPEEAPGTAGPSSLSRALRALSEQAGNPALGWDDSAALVFFGYETMLDLAACTAPTGVDLLLSPSARLARALAATVLRARPSVASAWAHRLHGTAEILCNLMGRVSSVLQKAGAPAPRQGTGPAESAEGDAEDRTWPVLATLSSTGIALTAEDVIALRRMLALAADAANSVAAILRLAPDLAYAAVCGHPDDYPAPASGKARVVARDGLLAPILPGGEVLAEQGLMHSLAAAYDHLFPMLQQALCPLDGDGDVAGAGATTGSVDMTSAVPADVRDASVRPVVDPPEEGAPVGPGDGLSAASQAWCAC